MKNYATPKKDEIMQFIALGQKQDVLNKNPWMGLDGSG